MVIQNCLIYVTKMEWILKITQQPFYSEWSGPNLVLQVFQWFIIAIIKSIQPCYWFSFSLSFQLFQHCGVFKRVGSSQNVFKIRQYEPSDLSLQWGLLVDLFNDSFVCFLGYRWHCKDSPPTTKFKLSILFLFCIFKVQSLLLIWKWCVLY